MYTRCPTCLTCFRVTERHLAIANGKVRCGQCQHVFNAPENSIDDLPISELTAATPSQPIPPAQTAAEINTSAPIATKDDDKETESPPVSQNEAQITSDKIEDRHHEVAIEAGEEFVSEDAEALSEPEKEILIEPQQAEFDASTEATNGADSDAISTDTPHKDKAQFSLELPESETDIIDTEELLHPEILTTPEVDEDASDTETSNIADAKENQADKNEALDLTEAAAFEFSERDHSDINPDISGQEIMTSDISAEDDQPEDVTDPFSAELDLSDDDLYEFDSVRPEETNEVLPEVVKQNNSTTEEFEVISGNEAAHKDDTFLNLTDGDNENLHENYAQTENTSTQSNSDIPTQLREDIARLQKPSARKTHPIISMLVIIVLTAITLFQLAYFRSFEIADKFVEARPYLKQFCEKIPCHYSGPKDADAIQLLSRDIRVHPDEKNALLISAVMVNKAAFAQPYPDIKIRLSDLSGNIVAERSFSEKTYMGHLSNPFLLMKPNTPVHIHFEVVDPGKDAVNFEFSFR